MPGKSSYERGRIQTGSGLEKEVQKYAEKRGRTVFRNIDITGKMMAQQAMNEFDFDNRLQQIEDKMIQGEATVQTTTGVLPMNIQIPTSGQLFRFAKNIVRDEELKITMHYFKETVFKGIAWFCILVIILIILLGRQKVKSVLPMCHFRKCRQMWILLMFPNITPSC